MTGTTTTTAPPAAKERPIIFTGGNPGLIVAGHKTMTRRVVEGDPHRLPFAHRLPDGSWEFSDRDEPSAAPVAEQPGVRCRHGDVGDRLWVKEGWRSAVELDVLTPRSIGQRAVEAGYARPWMPTRFDSDGTTLNWDPTTWGDPGRRRNARYLPRWASRSILEVTELRVERLQAITEADVEAEGLTSWTKDGRLWKWGPCEVHVPSGERDPLWPWTDLPTSAREAWARTWDGIHGAGAWEADPWVWVVGFKRVEVRP
ncbi:MAG: Mx8p14 [Phycisphaerales bacterium]|nr:Mx8p14 [Phycisphaerales bacterium]